MKERDTLRIAGTRRGGRTVIIVDGRPAAAHEGEMLAAALLAAGIRELRPSPTERTPRGAFCYMGVCQECAVEVDGVRRQACMVRVTPRMSVVLGGGFKT
ncbi:MAG TPA: 2Fe-2S iron-sulfur cluster-binding protein [Hyphomicrobiaceae bacterium]|nr:2Fe-2S iron-sulfur cluster-binding protein [Hyphomicrobiaceae bacterium]